MARLGFPDAAALRSAANSYLTVCFHQETPPRAGELAANLTIAAHQLTRTFQQLLRTTPSVYLKNGQVAHAKLLLSTTEMSMNEIAYASAFGTRMSFFRTFRRATGI